MTETDPREMTSALPARENARSGTRLLAVDYGRVRVGVAISDPLGMIARGLETIAHRGKTAAQVAARIAELVKQYAIGEIILGLPKRTDGQESEHAESIREFAALLASETGLTPVLFDERYTTVLAQRVMRETGMQREKRRDVVDQIAAEILLQDYLEKRRSESATRI